MAISCACPSCAAPFSVPDDLAGKRVKCAQCTIVFNVPAPPPAGDRPAQPPVKDLFREPAHSEPERKSSKRAGRDDDRYDSRDRGRDRDEPQPRRSKGTRARGSVLPWVLGLGGAALVLFLLCGGGIAVVAVVGLSARKAAVPPPPVRMAVNNQAIAQQPGIAAKGNAGPAVKVGPGGEQDVQLKQGVAKRIKLANGQFQTTTQLTIQDPLDPDHGQCHCKLYQVDLQAGRTYQIDMTSPNSHLLDPYLRVEDANEVVLVEDDDSGGNFNARIRFTPNVTGAFVVVATCFQPNQFGAYTLTIRDTTGAFK
jgi:predicted Zn finger-like uncharacterized protein